MKHSENDVIISGVNVDLTAELKQKVHDKMEKLFNHENHIVRIRVELGQDNAHKDRPYYAKGQIEIRGPDKIVTVHDRDISSAIDLLENKLNRQLRRRSRLRRVKRKDTHEVDIPAYIPKVQVA